MTPKMATGSHYLIRSLTRSGKPCQHFKSHSLPRQYLRRPFHASAPALVIKPFILADIGEGKPIRIIVLENARVNCQQASRKSRSYNGSSSPKRESSNSISYARCNRTRRLRRSDSPSLRRRVEGARLTWKGRSRPGSMELLRSCITRPRIWRKWARYVARNGRWCDIMG